MDEELQLNIIGLGGENSTKEANIPVKWPRTQDRKPQSNVVGRVLKKLESKPDGIKTVNKPLNKRPKIQKQEISVTKKANTGAAKESKEEEEKVAKPVEKRKQTEVEVVLSKNETPKEKFRPSMKKGNNK